MTLLPRTSACSASLCTHHFCQHPRARIERQRSTPLGTPSALFRQPLSPMELVLLLSTMILADARTLHSLPAANSANEAPYSSGNHFSLATRILFFTLLFWCFFRQRCQTPCAMLVHYRNFPTMATLHNCPRSFRKFKYCTCRNCILYSMFS